MKTCEQYQEQMVLALYGELAEGGRRDLQRHMDACRDCRAMWGELQEAATATSGVRFHKLPAEDAARLARRMREARTPLWTLSGWIEKWFKLPAPVFTAGLCLLLVLGGAYLLRPRTAEPGDSWQDLVAWAMEAQVDDELDSLRARVTLLEGGASWETGWDALEDLDTEVLELEWETYDTTG
jgi:hypothetical protein